MTPPRRVSRFKAKYSAETSNLRARTASTEKQQSLGVAVVSHCRMQCDDIDPIWAYTTGYANIVHEARVNAVGTV